MNLLLPGADGALKPYTLRGPGAFDAPTAPFNRVAYAAAHVVADPRAAINPWQQTAIDWDATLAYRHYLWSLGFGVAEAMDTAQRGMGMYQQAVDRRADRWCRPDQRNGPRDILGSHRDGCYRRHRQDIRVDAKPLR